MAVQDADRFVEKLKNDGNFSDELAKRRLPKDGENMPEYYADVAKNFGFSFTAEELQKAVTGLQKTNVKAVETADISDTELQQISGGKDRCSTTYNKNENCLFTDWCRHAVNFYKEDKTCQSTYDSSFSCFKNDYCHKGSNSYRG